MFKLTYILTRKGQPSAIPVPVCGKRTNKIYGHAHFDAKVLAHTFRVSSELWDAGAGEDIMQFRASIPPWIVRCEVEFDPTSAMGEQAAQLDAVKAESEGLRLLLETREAENAALRSDLETLSGMVASGGDGGENVLDAPTPKAEDKPPGVEERLASMRFPDLQQEAEKQNALGAEIPLKDIKSKIVLREALAEWYNSEKFKALAPA